jgi:site-specific recombinase XerD
MRAPKWNAAEKRYDFPPHRGVTEKHKGSGVWWAAVYDAAGKRHREQIGGYEAAVNRQLAGRQEVREGKYVSPLGHGSAVRRAAAVGPTFGELCEKLLENQAGRVSPAHHTECTYKKRVLCEDYGLEKIPAGQITVEQIEDVLAEIEEETSGATANRYRSFMVRMFSFGEEREFVTRNPILKVPKYKETEGRVRFLRDEENEEARLREKIRQLHPAREAEFDLALNTGARKGEQFRILRQDVNLAQHVMTVKGKTGRRPIALNDTAVAALEDLMGRHTGPNVIVDYRHGDHQKDWRRWFKECVDAAGIPDFRYHDLRHTFASRLVMKGNPLRVVQDLLGHKSLAMTLRYSHLAPGFRQAAVNTLDGGGTSPAPNPTPAPVPPQQPPSRTAARGGANVVEFRKRGAA